MARMTFQVEQMVTGGATHDAVSAETWPQVDAHVALTGRLVETHSPAGESGTVISVGRSRTAVAVGPPVASDIDCSFRVDKRATAPESCGRLRKSHSTV